MNIRRRNSTFHSKNCDNIQALSERGVNTWSACFLFGLYYKVILFETGCTFSCSNFILSATYEESSLPYKLAFHFNITLHITASQLLSYFQTGYKTIQTYDQSHDVTKRPPLVVVCAVFLLQKLLKPEPEKSNYSSSVFCPFVDQPPPLLTPPSP